MNRRPPYHIAAPTFKNNQTTLKQIYQDQTVFKPPPPIKKYNVRNIAPISKKQKQQQQKHTSFHLNLINLKQNNRYIDNQKQTRGLSVSINQMIQNNRLKNKQIGNHTSRNVDLSTQRTSLFKIKKKSISGSLRKKNGDKQMHQFSASPVPVTDLDFTQEGFRYYKQKKYTQALKMFERVMEKDNGNMKVKYFSAMCFLSRQKYNQALSLLTSIIEIDPQYKKTVYLFAAIASNHQKQYETAVQFCSKGISYYPKDPQLYFYRAKMNEQLNTLQKAIQDYQKVLQIKKDHVEAMFNNAKCLKKLGLDNKSLFQLNTAFHCDKNGQFKQRILIERIKLNFNSNNFIDVKKDIERLQTINGQNGQVYYYKGQTFKKQNNQKQALLCYQKCIRLNTNKQAVADSLIQIVKSKINQRDFYSANHHIKRSDFLQIRSEQVQKLRLFVTGVVFLMKRKTTEAVKNFNKLEKQYIPLGQYIQKLFYLYRAYGYFMQSKHQLAVKDYQTSQKYIVRDRSITYNMLISKGVQEIRAKQFRQASKYFQQAQNTINKGSQIIKIQPLLYKSMGIIEQDQIQVLEQVFQALKQLDKAYDINQNNSNVLYLRSLIYMYLKKTDQGLQDIIKAISKSQQNVAKYFFYRALAHQTLQNQKQALNDFNICINLDQNMANAYLQRSKVLFANDQGTKGCEDLQKYVQLRPNIDINAIKCALYYINNDLQSAGQYVSYIKDQSRRNLLKCLIDIKQIKLQQALSYTIKQGDKAIIKIMLGVFDAQVNQDWIEDLQIFNKVQFYNYLGIRKFYLGAFQDALNYYSMALKQKSLLDLQSGQLQESNEEEQQANKIAVQTRQNQKQLIYYNMYVTLLANKQIKKAYQLFVRDILPSKTRFLRDQQMGAMSRLLFSSVRSKDNSKPQQQLIQVYPYRNILDEAMGSIDIQMPTFVLRTKLCYLIPFSNSLITQFSPKINPQFILQCLTIDEVQNRPQPPWVKRKQSNLIFTDEVVDIDIQFQPTQHDLEDEEQQYQQDQQGQQQQQNEQENTEDNEQKQEFDPRKFRDKMKLDDDIQKKLKKIMEKNKNNQ